MKISKNQDRQTRGYFKILEENILIAATKIKFLKKKKGLVKIYFHIIFQTYFWCTESCYQGLKGASAKIPILKIFSDYFHCQLVAPSFVKYFINFLPISSAPIAALLLLFEFCSISPNTVYSFEDPGIRSTLLTMRLYFKK